MMLWIHLGLGHGLWYDARVDHYILQRWIVGLGGRRWEWSLLMIDVNGILMQGHTGQQIDAILIVLTRTGMCQQIKVIIPELGLCQWIDVEQ